MPFYPSGGNLLQTIISNRCSDVLKALYLNIGIATGFLLFGFTLLLNTVRALVITVFILENIRCCIGTVVGTMLLNTLWSV